MTWKVGKEHRQCWFVDRQSINHSNPIGFFDSPWFDTCILNDPSEVNLLMLGSAILHTQRPLAL